MQQEHRMVRVSFLRAQLQKRFPTPLFPPVEFTVTEKKEVALCQCKQTKTSPYCDGTHQTL
jgi:CDGSH-type Zn-finger protein